MHRSMVVALAVGALLASTTALAAQAPPEPARASVGIGVEQTPSNAEHPGVVIREVTVNSPGAKAGLQPGDVITRVGDRDVRNYEDLVNTVARHKPGDKLAFQVWRGGKEQTLTVTLGERRTRLGRQGAVPPQPGAQPPALGGGARPRGRQPAFLGIQTAPLTSEARERLGVTVNEGTLVTEVVPDTPADRAGLKVDDVITSVNGRPTPDPERLREIVRSAGVGTSVDLKVARGKKTMDVKARLEEVPSDIGMLGPMGNLPPFGRGFPGMLPQGRLPAITTQMEQLQRRVDELERRVRELEQKQGRGPSK